MAEVQKVTAFCLLTKYCHRIGASYKVAGYDLGGGIKALAEVEFSDGTRISSQGQDVDAAIYKLLEKLED